MTMIRAFILLGGVTGSAWEAYVPGVNTGMLGLRDQIVALGVPVTVYPWGSYAQCDADIFANVVGHSVVIGYSGGGSRATYLKSHVDLLVGYDPSPSYQVSPLRTNVGTAICYYNTSPFFFGLGGGAYKLAADNKTTILHTITVSEQHLAVQYDSSLHAHTIAAIRGLM